MCLYICVCVCAYVYVYVYVYAYACVYAWTTINLAGIRNASGTGPVCAILYADRQKIWIYEKKAVTLRAFCMGYPRGNYGITKKHKV